jgi:alkanesulfonate monooxygenase
VTVEVAWFAALCDDDYEYLGVAEPRLASSWDHCRAIVLTAEAAGFDRVLLPSGYALGIDATTFAAAIAPQLSSLGLLLAVRSGEVWLPQLARQIASLDQITGGRLAINIISSERPGEQLDGPARYRRTLEEVEALRALLSGHRVDVDGEFVRLHVDAPRIRSVGGSGPPVYFGGLSSEARDVAARIADVYLMWPDTMEGLAATIADVRARAAAVGRTVRFGYRVHVIVRESEDEARAEARRLVSRLDDEVGAAIRARSLDSTSVGVRRQAELREGAGDDGYVEECLWTGIGRARSGCGAAVVGDPEQVAAKLLSYRSLGIDSFILSGYPHLEEAERFGRLVRPALRKDGF